MALIPDRDLKPLYKDIKQLNAVLLKKPTTSLQLQMLLVNVMVGLQILGQKIKIEPVRILGEHLHKYLAFLPEDMGLFSGIEARKLFAEILAFKMPLNKQGKPQFNATFKDHFDHFGIKLVITGTNLETGQSGLFQ